MNNSISITAISPDLVKAQKEIGSAKKEAKNPFFHSTYADLGSVMEACKDALNKNNITILQPVMGNYVETILLHTSGEWISSHTPIVTKEPNNPQALGSAITYARRYGLQSMVFIPAEDDDGEKATQHTADQEVRAFPNDEGNHAVAEEDTKCPKCGAPMKISKTGSKYCSALCWKKGEV